MNNQALLSDNTLQLEPWFSPKIRQRLHGKSVETSFPRTVRRALKIPRKIPVSDHAEKHRVVTAVDASPGRWRPELVPHAKKPMNTYGLPWVEEVWICAVERSAKTNIMLNCMGWAIDCEPGNIFCLNPTETDSGKIISKKIIPMLENSPRLSRYLGRNQNDTTKTLIGLNHGMTIFPAHSNSASSMASFYGKHSFGEEVDKYPLRTGKEADPITLIRKRGRDRRGSKRLFSSTPAQKFIWKGIQECHQVWVYVVLCPECGQHFLPTQEHIDIQEGATVEAVERSEAEVHLACRQQGCGALLTEVERAAAYRWGRWTAIKGADIVRPAKVGFHLPAWGLPTVPLPEIAAAILRAKRGDLAAKIALANGYGAVDYVEELSDRKEDVILRLCDERPAGICPVWTDALEISIDTQDDGFWYRIRAWKFGPEMESALVKAGFAESFTALETIIWGSEYPDAEGRKHRIMGAIIDTQGHRTAEVYEWCKRTGVMGAKGAQGRKTVPVTVSVIQHFPGTNKPIPGGLRLYHIDTHFHKDALALKLMVEPGDPGCFWLHSGYTEGQLGEFARNPGQKISNGLEGYAKQMCAEGRNEKNLWDNPQERPNHLWDCESNGLALAMYLGFQNRKKENEISRQSGPRVLSPGV